MNDAQLCNQADAGTGSSLKPNFAAGAAYCGVRPHMKLIVKLLVMMPLLGEAFACDYDPPMPFEEVVENAQHIAVVQILSQELTDRIELRRPVIVGRLQLIEVLLGEPDFKSVEFSNVPCGGVRLDVGHYYVMFTSQTGPVLRLVPADNSLIGLAGQYSPLNPRQNNEERFFRSVRDYVDGRISADKVDPFPLIERNGTVRRIDCIVHRQGPNYAINATPEQALRSNRAILPARVIAALAFYE